MDAGPAFSFRRPTQAQLPVSAEDWTTVTRTFVVRRLQGIGSAIRVGTITTVAPGTPTAPVRLLPQQ